MAIFAVLADEPHPELGAKIISMFPGDQSLRLSDCQWLISAPLISQALADQLDVKSGVYGRVLVLLATASGSGWHSKSVWEWLTLKTGSVG